MPQHRIALLVDLTTGGAPFPLAAERMIEPGGWNVGLLAHRQGGYDLDAVASLQDDGVLTVTVGLQWLSPERGWRDDGERAVDAWSSVVPADGTTDFVLEVRSAGSAQAVAQGVIVHDVLASGSLEDGGEADPR